MNTTLSNTLQPQTSLDSDTSQKPSAKARPNVFVRLFQALGFKKGYNFVLWFIFGGAMFGFVLARFMYLHPPTLLNGVVPGEGFWLRGGLYKAAMLVHLGTVLPAGLFAIFQFVPTIRYRAIIVHRLMGYASLLLLFVGTGAAFAMMRHSMGGDLSIQSAVVFLGTATLISAIIAWFNIKKLQIDQHRKWMLRTWFYAGSIITVRLVMIITAKIVAAIGQYYTDNKELTAISSVWRCEEVLYTIDNNSTMLEELYPTCLSGFLDTEHVAVPALWTTALNIGSALRMSFGPALWIGTLLHAIGVEIYIHLTPGETARLRKVSYQRQLEKGVGRPGSMGTVGDRLGDNFGVQYKPEY
ncbi:hypothetical protein AAF712_002399 [Marasmius tenuissimus]|uniref:DUF2306 domain-containing protein n=1 Tax=Marasmius tenuissimus TaxID=585030 RepID=A0ABR3A9C4_9AGAR